MNDRLTVGNVRQLTSDASPIRITEQVAREISRRQAESDPLSYMVRENVAHKGRFLLWFPEIGMGYYPVEGQSPYDTAYFDKYVGYAETPLGAALNKFRLGLVKKYVGSASVLDVGIGCGQFIESRPNTKGIDTNPRALSWLTVRELLASWTDSIPNITFWDSLEHLPDPAAVVHGRETCFVSVPIFTDADHVLRSRHYRKDEHYWYWTHNGLINWFKRCGFGCIEYSDEESRLGREDILTYVFRRTVQ